MKTKLTAYGIALALTYSLTATATLKAQNVYIGTEDNGAVGESGSDGSTVNTSLPSGFNHPFAIANSGNDLIVASNNTGINASLISDLGEPDGIAISSGLNELNVIPVPERSTVALAGLGLGLGAALWLRRRAV